jgi:hypothetical protein
MAKKKTPSQPPPIDDGYHEFYGEHDDPDDAVDIEAILALRRGDAAGLAQELRQIHCPVSDLLGEMADCLVSKDQTKFRLKFVKPKGRPADRDRIHKDGDIRTQVKLALRKLKTDQLESAVQHVMTKLKLSRSRIFRALGKKSAATKSGKA